jgi:two-component sensor histidine kinase
MMLKGSADSDGFEFVGDDALLLHEFAHRTANQVAAAMAALRLARRAKPGASIRLLETAACRLEAFGELNRVLARPVGRLVNVAADISAVCGAIAAGATAASRSEMLLRLPDLWIDGGTARRLVLVASELVNNAVRHALDGRAGRLEVSLGVEGDEVVLSVSDDGSGVRTGARSAGTGLGSGIVAQLVGRGGGSIRMDTGRSGTTVRVVFPLHSACDGSADVF